MQATSWADEYKRILKLFEDNSQNGQRQAQDQPLMTRDELLDVYRRSGALLEGHFRLTSGLHSPGYLQCALVLQYPQHAEALGRAIAEWRPRSACDRGALAGARRGGDRPRSRSRPGGARDVRRAPGRGLTLRRGFIIGESDRVLVVEDVLTTGGSTRETIRVAKAAGAQVVGAASIVNRGPAGGPGQPGDARAADLGVPFVTLLTIDLPAYEPDKCPLCVQGLPVVKPGSRPVAV